MSIMPGEICPYYGESELVVAVVGQAKHEEVQGFKTGWKKFFYLSSLSPTAPLTHQDGCICLESNCLYRRSQYFLHTCLLMLTVYLDFWA